MAEAPRDQNFVPAALFEIDGSPGSVMPGQIDQVTGRILVDLPGGGGTVTDVSVATANGFAGTVADSTTTPEITIETTVTGITKGDGTALSAAVAGTDYVAPGAITTSGLTMATARLLGRTTASTGAVEEISVGSGLTLSAGTLSAAAAALTVGSTTIASGTNTRVLYDNAGVLGEYVISGTGNVAMTDSPTFTTRINSPDIRATGAGGVAIENSGGTQVAIFGAGVSTGTSLQGTTNIGAASADYFQLAGGTGTITNTATGSSTNISINLVPKGTGRLQANAVNVPTISSADTITNKRNQPRTASSTSNANLDPDLATANVYYRTTQTTGLTIGAPTGTPVIGETIAIYVDSAGAQTLTINSTYKAFGSAFPASTTAGKTFMMVCQFNGTDWKCTWSNAV